MVQQGTACRYPALLMVYLYFSLYYKKASKTKRNNERKMYNISINRLFLLGFSLNFSMTALYLLFQQKRIHKRMNISPKDTLYIVRVG